MLRKKKTMKEEIDEAVEQNKRSIRRAEQEVDERKDIDAHLKRIQIELDNMTRK